MTFVIGEPCIDVKDKACVVACPVDCIHEADRILVIDPDTCIDCNACVAPCPVDAISADDIEPVGGKDFILITNAYPEGLDRVNELVEIRIKAHPPPPIPGYRD